MPNLCLKIYKQPCNEQIADLMLLKQISITNNDTAEKETSRNSRQLLRRLHVKDGDNVLQGAKAFLHVWKKIPKYKFLYNILKLPIIFNLFSFGYEVVAFFLYLKNKKQLKD